MSNFQVEIVLGCFGCQDDDFLICPGIENVIYKFNSEHQLYSEISNYLDKCKLYDRALLDYTSIRNFLVRFKESFNQPTKPTWLEKKYENYQKFVINHRQCGLYLKLNLVKEQTQNTFNPKLLRR